MGELMSPMHIARVAQGITTEQVAAWIGRSRNHVRAVEDGRSPLRPTWIGPLSLALRVPVSMITAEPAGMEIEDAPGGWLITIAIVDGVLTHKASPPSARAPCPLSPMRLARVVRGIRLEEVAAHLGVDNSHPAKMEVGVREIGDYATRIAELLGAPVSMITTAPVDMAIGETDGGWQIIVTRREVTRG